MFHRRTYYEGIELTKPQKVKIMGTARVTLVGVLTNATTNYISKRENRRQSTQNRLYSLLMNKIMWNEREKRSLVERHSVNNYYCTSNLTNKKIKIRTLLNIIFNQNQILIANDWQLCCDLLVVRKEINKIKNEEN